MQIIFYVFQILEIYEVWHYEKVEQYHPINNPDGGLFTAYINQFMAMKQESDGWPGWVQTDQDKDRYINSTRKGKVYSWILPK
jgi:hypothetical protein